MIIFARNWIIAPPVVLKIDIHPLRIVYAGSSILVIKYPVFISIWSRSTYTVKSHLFLRYELSFNHSKSLFVCSWWRRCLYIVGIFYRGFIGERSPFCLSWLLIEVPVMAHSLKDVVHGSYNKFIMLISLPILIYADDWGNSSTCSYNLRIHCARMHKRVSHWKINQKSNAVNDKCLCLYLFFLVILL